MAAPTTAPSLQTLLAVVLHSLGYEAIHLRQIDFDNFYAQQPLKNNLRIWIDDNSVAIELMTEEEAQREECTCDVPQVPERGPETT